MDELLKDAIFATNKFVNDFFPDSHTVFLAGSVVRGEATSTSDLDIVIITDKGKLPFRESFVEYSWRIEAFVHNENTLEDFFESDIKRNRPSLPMMCFEGIIIKNEIDLADKIKSRCEYLLNKGPIHLTEEDIKTRRYFITDLLDDFEGSNKYEESIFIANNLSANISELILLSNGKWIGEGKWIPRSLEKYDLKIKNELINSLNSFYKLENKEPLISFVEKYLANFGGKLFKGYKMGKD